MRRRFFVGKFDSDRAVLEGDAAHHLGRVLRAQPGQLYELSDGERARLARIEAVQRDRVEFVLLEEVPAYHPPVDVTLLLAIVKFEAFEWALEKATELGVSTIVPLSAERSEKGLVAAAAKRAERWQKIVLEASQQSRRVKVPELRQTTRPEAAFRQPWQGMKLLLSERGAPPLRERLAEAGRISQAVLAVGPEGGWTDAEFQAAQAGKLFEVSMGGLILRAETAVLAALAALNYACG